MNYLFLVLIVLVASFVQSTVGFGFAVLSVAFFPLVFPYTKALSYVQAIAIISTLTLAIKHRKSTRWKVLLPMLIPAMVIGSVTTWFSLRANSDVLYMLLGFVLIAVSVYSLAIASKVKIRPTVLNGSIMGVCNGLSNGFFAIGGPPAALYLLPATDSKEEYLACIQTLFVCTNSLNLGVRIYRGAFELSDLPLIATGWAAMLIGTAIGQVAFKRIDAKLFNKLVYVVVGLNGLWIVLSRLFG